MKRVLAVLLGLIFLVGCSKTENAMERALELRKKLQSAEQCSFSAEITADYGQNVYTFGMQCTMEPSGAVKFTVTSPDTIAGITGTMDSTGGKLTFDGKVLAFEKMADRQITPVSAPWLLIQTLRGGYLSACSKTEDGYRLTIDDSYEENALQLEIWLDHDFVPKEAEILWQGKRFLSLVVTDFVIT